MNIYIYGDNTFKSEVNNIINHSNLRLYIDDDSHIEEIDSVDTLKLLIEQEPEHIYLIDDDKIINPNSINSKISFLKPKGGIEKDFLEEHGVLDSKFESIEELIQDLKDKFQEKEKQNNTNQTKQENDFEFEDDSEDYSFDNSIDYGEEIEGLASDDNFDEDLDENIEKNDIIQESENSNLLQEYPMPENIDDIDNITEEAMLNALDNMDDIDISHLKSSSSEAKSSYENVQTTPTEEINLSGNSVNANEIASLISQLLSNKTLEITIKVKS